MALSAKVELVTPKKAQEWLGKQVVNRNLRPNIVMRHAESMRNGEWHLTGEAIKFAEDGTLMDGQHRLQAVIEANVDVAMLVVRGVDVGAIVSMDTGLKRRLSDVLKMRGEANVTRLAAALVHIQLVRTAIELEKWPYQTQKRDYGTFYPTNDESLRLLEKEPEIRDAVADTRRFEIQHTGLHVRPVVWGVSKYILDSIDQEDSEEFFRQAAKGLDVVEGGPVAAFRRRFATSINTPISTRDQFALLFKAWNFWRKGETPALLRYSPGGKYAEKFPRPE